MTTDTQAPLVTRLKEPDVALPRLAGTPNTVENKKKPVFHFPVKVSLKTDEGLRKYADVKPGVKGYGAYQLWSDEGTGLPPGADSAPAPLVYFAAGAAFCLVSHLTNLADDRKLDVRNIEVESELSFGYVKGEAGQRGVCLGLRYLVDIDSDAPQEQLRQLIQEAKGMCLAEAALAEPVKIQTLLAVKGDVVDPDVAVQGGEMKHAFPTASS
ncbi:OsmC-related (seleno)protein [Mycobacterium sp. pUA109]|uniref:OsmC-related (seleno)protein n=1 Tax=Mycobacterium sp. pUA109 TaxID=3238982 RepID=UPI00351B76EF